jgi:hypothetical protein
MDRSADAFVLWIDGESAADGALVGRIEHVQSAVRGTFQSTHELLAFLASHRSLPARPPDGEGSS